MSEAKRRRGEELGADPGRWIPAVFVFGLAVSCAMLATSQVGGDQLNMLARGWMLAFDGVWVPTGSPASGGGHQPGGISSLLVGLPLFVWSHHRAATLVILVSHVFAFLLLDRTLRRILRPDERLLFAVLFWLNPWRVFHSGFLWNPNYLFLVGALHLATAWSLRRKARFWPSFVHLLALGLGAEIHLSYVMLILTTLFLWWRGYLRLHVVGALVGGLVALLPMIPWVLAVRDAPAGMTGGEEGFLGWGFVAFYPIVQGLLHWLRYPAIALSRSMACLDFSRLGGPGFSALAPYLSVVRWSLLLPTLILSIWANARLWRGSGGAWRRRLAPEASDREWLVGVVRWSLIAALISFGLSPVSISRWYVLPMFHIAILPLVLATGDLLRGGRPVLTRRLVAVYAGLLAAIGLVLFLGNSRFQCGAPHCEIKALGLPNLSSDHPMLDDLGIRRTCPPVVNDPEGWWMDVLPQAPPAPPPG